jgi:hypothetical protein
MQCAKSGKGKTAFTIMCGCVLRRNTCEIVGQRHKFGLPLSARVMWHNSADERWQQRACHGRSSR